MGSGAHGASPSRPWRPGSRLSIRWRNGQTDERNADDNLDENLALWAFERRRVRMAQKLRLKLGHHSRGRRGGGDNPPLEPGVGGLREIVRRDLFLGAPPSRCRSCRGSPRRRTPRAQGGQPRRAGEEAREGTEARVDALGVLPEDDGADNADDEERRP